MQLTRPVSAADPRNFGRRARARPEESRALAGSASDDLRLFGTSFAAGFLFVFLLIV